MDFFSILTLVCLLNFHQSPAAEEIGSPRSSTLETYIVRVDAEQQSGDIESWHNSYLPTNLAASDVDRPRVLYHYRHVFSGFAAKMSAAHVETMQQKAGFISARRERVLPLQTTHSPNFLGLNRNVGFWNTSGLGKGVIVGVIDTGITPDHPSFSDEGMAPPPGKWKGKCELPSRACNRKLIGARSFGNGDPLDEEGHGSHTSGTAAGNFVTDANIFGNANGMAAGVAPLAHLATYKACGSNGCGESDVTAALEAAIGDGVDILSLSLGGDSVPFHLDNIAIGAYRAMEKGILVSCAAGNEGPGDKSLSNEAPWILTVGASTIDRKLSAVAVLGNKEELSGQSAFQPKDSVASSKQLELVQPEDDQFCDFLETDLTGKIVVCEMGGIGSRTDKGKAVKDVGGAAMILINDDIQGDSTFAEAHVLPATHISYADALKLKSYMNSTAKPTASVVFKGTVIGDDRAPIVAGFSSRGPSSQSPGILKPDVIGPGVSILAAWPVSVENKTNTKSTFNIISGTSMACPHLSGVAALLKSAHPNWSPAAIKSAIMTTANHVNLAGKPILDQRLLRADIFAMGSGHVNPPRANDPGLIYDIKPDAYIPYLCGLNYTNEEIGVILNRKVDCSRESRIPEAELNYPSFSISLGPSPQTYTRTVTNVGEANSSYDVEVVSPDGVSIKVEPTKLNFSQVNQNLSYNVTFTRDAAANEYAQGLLRWNSAKHSVASPIVVAFK